MYKSMVVHYKNKYPDANVVGSDSALDVFLGDRHMVALRKNGAGMWVDCSQELGCEDLHDAAPIPQNARFRKLHKDGSIRKSEEASEREPVNRKLAELALGGVGKVPSCEELKLAGATILAGEPGDSIVCPKWLDAQASGRSSAKSAK